MAKRIAKDVYLAKAQKLSKNESERLFSRMRGKLGRRLGDYKLDSLEALAIQLEIEDEDLAEWRNRFAEIKSHTKKIGGLHSSINV